MKEYIIGLNKWKKSILSTNINVIQKDILATLRVITKLEERKAQVNDSSNFLYQIKDVLSLFTQAYCIPSKGPVYTFLSENDEYVIPQKITNERARIPIKQGKDIKMHVCGLCKKIHPIICRITETEIIKFIICYEKEKLYELERKAR